MTQKSNPLLDLGNLGQSIWLDYIRRGLIASGGLEKLIREDGLKGVTSNPTIFEKAIGGSSDYDEAIKAALSQKKSVLEIYDWLVFEDIGKAADLFLPVYRKTGGADGFVSIEVSPGLAGDTEKSIQEARRLFSSLNRPNIFVKIPGTSEGVPAIETLIAEGINVNITLLFSIENYEQVMEAYLRGLEKRAGEGKPLNSVSSVASFFVSRVDTLVDALLEEKLTNAKSGQEKDKISALFGKAAVANAKLAYQRFLEIFRGPRFQALQAKGGRLQRPLWASTSTKNPKYSDILYVQELIAGNSVNTMPMETIAAFRDHGTPRVTIQEGLEEARSTMRQLSGIGLDFRQITKKLQENGVKLFEDSFQKLMQEIEAKRSALLSAG